MVLRRSLAILIALGASTSAVQAQLSGSYVKAAIVGPPSATAGRAFNLLVRLEIQDGYHIQAADAKDPYIPTRLSVTGPAGFAVGAPAFPASTAAEVAGETLSVYEGRAEIKIPVTAPGSAHGSQTFKATVRYQACNATNCYPPAEVTVEGDVAFGAPSGAAASPRAAKKPAAAAITARSEPSPRKMQPAHAPAIPETYPRSTPGRLDPPLAPDTSSSSARGYVTVTAALPQEMVPGKPFTVRVSVAVRPGYHIQSHAPAPGYIPTDITVVAAPGSRVGQPTYPKPSTAEVAGQRIPVYEGTFTVTVPVTLPAGIHGERFYKVKIRYQACNATSCYPPQEAIWTVSDKAGAAKRPEAEPPAPPQPAPGTLTGFTVSRIEQFVGPQEFVGFLKGGPGGAGTGVLESLLRRSLLLALPLIFVLGVALNLTPCVYPIIPITISYFGGQAARQGQKPLTLALFYVLGMAIMYSALGVAAGMTGTLFGSQLQNPWVLAVFALVMFGLALSQFDRKDGRPIWELQLPAGLRNRATSRSGVFGAMLMGLLVGTVAAPCIGPAVVALLQWVSTQRSPVLGFASFFTLALGLGAPYVVLATVSGSVKRLPRSGEWMIGVKHMFGVVLIWMGVYYLQTILNGLRPGLGQMALVVATAGGGIYLLVDRSGVSARAFTGFRRAAAVAALIAAAWLALPPPAEAIRWQPYSDQAVNRARADNRTVLIDFTAAWCAACKELEHKTFSDATVGSVASGFVTLRADMTNWEGQTSQKLKERYGIVGLPTVVRLAPRSDPLADR